MVACVALESDDLSRVAWRPKTPFTFPDPRCTLALWVNQSNLIKSGDSVDHFKTDHCDTETPRIRRGDLQLLPEPDVAHLAAVAKALSDPIRVQMIHLLQQHPDLCTCEFEELLGLAQSKVSYHLKVLLEAGLVNRETYGTWSHYHLRKPAVLEQLKALAK